MPYTRPYATGFKDSPDTTTPIDSTALNTMDLGIKTANDAVDAVSTWVSFTPSWGGLTVTTGTNDAKYAQIGKTVIFSAKFTFGASSAVTGSLTLTLPVAGRATGSGIFAGVFSDTGTNDFIATPVMTSATVLTLYATNAAGTYASRTATSSTIPFTWVSGDIIYVSGVYEAA